MSLARPYRRTVRQLSDGSYAQSGHGKYVEHAKHAQAGAQYVRSFLLIQKDLLELFDFVEPADVNSPCYSYRIHALLLRACVEIEANCKAILRENGYVRKGNWNTDDYRKIDASHGLSRYRVIMPLWTGPKAVRAPFRPWADATASLPWYDAYNSTKHDRHEEFEQATFGHLVDACCALAALLFSQFRDHDFSGLDYWVSETPDISTESSVGNYFLIDPPRDWAPEQRYEFDWQLLRKEVDPFAPFDYSAL